MGFYLVVFIVILMVGARAYWIKRDHDAEKKRVAAEKAAEKANLLNAAKFILRLQMTEEKFNHIFPYALNTPHIDYDEWLYSALRSDPDILAWFESSLRDIQDMNRHATGGIQ